MTAATLRNAMRHIDLAQWHLHQAPTTDTLAVARTLLAYVNLLVLQAAERVEAPSAEPTAP